MAKQTFKPEPLQPGAAAENLAAAANETKANQSDTAAQPAAAEPAEPAKPEPTSDALTEIRANIDALLASFSTLTDRKALLDANMQLFKLNESERAELAEIHKAEQLAKLAEARNLRVAFKNDFEAALRTELAYMYETYNQSDKSQPFMDEMNAKTDATKAAGEKLVNELLTRFSASTPSKSVATGKTGESKNASKSELTGLHIANVAAGMSDAESRKALEALGHPRSTVWHAVNNYNKAK